MKTWLLAGLLAVTAAPVNAQDWGVTRRRFTFLDDEVTLEVIADIPGTLQVVRGEAGIIEAAARVDGGLSAFALGGRDETTLRLSALGGQRAEFMVVVPENVYLRIRLPNRNSQNEVGITRPAGVYSWKGKDEEAVGRSGGQAVRRVEGPEYVSDDAPASVSVDRLTAVRVVSVRYGSSNFTIDGLHITATGAGSSVEVRTGNQPDDVVINVPSGTRDFTLRLAGKTALAIRGGQVVSYCEPATEQLLSGGRHWVTFAPEAGLLTCR